MPKLPPYLKGTSTIPTHQKGVDVELAEDATAAAAALKVLYGTDAESVVADLIAATGAHEEVRNILAQILAALKKTRVH